VAKIKLHRSDCLKALSLMEDNYVDTIITDPPYALKFMGKAWDKVLPDIRVWQECLRVLKPGGFLLTFGGTRTFHRLTCNIEDAGFEIRDCIAWVYGSGFPKSHDISKAIGKASPEMAKQWNGWGTALKPAWEPIIVAMKPCEGTYVENARKHGVAGLNIDGGRIGTSDKLERKLGKTTVSDSGWKSSKRSEIAGKDGGRFPANFILSHYPECENGKCHSDCPVRMLDEQSGISKSSGGASRFFYCAKASKSERTMKGKVENKHPTVKPLKLVQYLCRLTKTPKGGIVLDPFMGSGTTGVACIKENRKFIGIEVDKEYYKIAKERIRTTLKENQHAKAKDKRP